MRDRDFEKLEHERERAAHDAEATRREHLALDRRDRLRWWMDPAHDESDLHGIESHFDVERAAMEERSR